MEFFLVSLKVVKVFFFLSPHLRQHLAHEGQGEVGAALLELGVIGLVSATASLAVLGLVRESWWVWAAALEWALVGAVLSWARHGWVKSLLAVLQALVERLLA